MPKSLSIALVVTDAAFLLYWTISGLALIGLVDLPPDWLYADYAKPEVMAWNWSFFPLDLAFSVLGLGAVASARRGSALWRPMALLSLTLTVVAGGMAVGYWALLCQFDPAWFLPNLALMVWPMFFLPGLIRDTASVEPAAP